MDAEIANIFVQTPGERKSGVRWNRVLPGLTFVRSAGIEAQQANPDSSLIRSLFITGLLFHLEALPADLSDNELSMIRAKAPSKLISRPTATTTTTTTSTTAELLPQCSHQCHGPDQTSISPSLRSRLELLLRANDHHHRKNQGPPASYPRVPSADSPFIHRLTALFVIYIFLFFQFMLPYISTAIHRIRRSERARRYLELAVVLAVGVAQNIRRHGSTIGSRVMKANDGKFARMFLRFAVWFSAAVLGGICEGVGEGVGILNGVR